MIALLAGIPIAGNVMVALSTTLTVFLSEAAKHDAAAMLRLAPEGTKAAGDPLPFLW